MCRFFVFCFVFVRPATNVPNVCVGGPKDRVLNSALAAVAFVLGKDNRCFPKGWYGIEMAV